MPVAQATVKWFNDAKGFGFTPSDFDCGSIVHQRP